MKRKQRKKILISFIFISTTLAAVFLPALFLHLSFSSKLNKTNKVEDELYRSDKSALSRSTSENLSEFERMKLISSLWESEVVEVIPGDNDMTKLEAVERVKNIVELLYTNSAYPTYFDDRFGDWYTWEAKYYRSTDISFHTYSAYYWEVTFYMANTDEYHKFLMTENGTLLAIRNNMEHNYINNSLEFYRLEKYYISDPYFYAKSFNVLNSANSHYFHSNHSNLPNNMYKGYTLEKPTNTKRSYLVLNNNYYTTEKKLEEYDSANVSKDTMVFCIIYQYNANEFSLNIVPWE